MKGGLGLGLAISGLKGGGSDSVKASSSGATFWSIAGTGNLQPDATSDSSDSSWFASDYNTTWNLTSDGTEISPEATPISDGFWVVNEISEGVYEISPKNV